MSPNPQYFGGREDEDVDENLGEEPDTRDTRDLELVKSQIQKQIEDTLWPYRDCYAEPNKLGAYGGAGADPGSLLATT